MSLAGGLVRALVKAVLETAAHEARPVVIDGSTPRALRRVTAIRGADAVHVANLRFADLVVTDHDDAVVGVFVTPVVVAPFGATGGEEEQGEREQSTHRSTMRRSEPRCKVNEWHVGGGEA